MIRNKQLTEIVKKYKDHSFVRSELGKRLSKRRHATQTEDTLGAYLNEAGTYGLLNEQEEKELFGYIDEAIILYNSIPNLDDLTYDQEQTFIEAVMAHQVILVTNLRLAVQQSKRLWNFALPELDIIQEANLGLMKAIARFDVHKGFKFSTYAVKWIEATTRRALADQSRTIRLPAHRHELFIKIKKRYEKLVNELSGQEPSPEQIETSTGMTYEEFSELMVQGSTFMRSLDAPIGEGSPGGVDNTLATLIPDVLYNVEEMVVRSGRKQTLKNHINRAKLNDREKFVLGLRSGLEPSYFPNLTTTVYGGGTITYEEAALSMPTTDGVTLAVVGEMLNISRERIRQIEATAFSALQDTVRPEDEDSELS